MPTKVDTVFRETKIIEKKWATFVKVHVSPGFRYVGIEVKA